MSKLKKIMAVALILIIPIYAAVGTAQAAESITPGQGLTAVATEPEKKEKKCRDLLTPQQGVDCLKKKEKESQNN